MNCFRKAKEQKVEPKVVDYGECIENGHDYRIHKEKRWSDEQWFIVQCSRCGYKTTTNHLDTTDKRKKLDDLLYG